MIEQEQKQIIMIVDDTPIDLQILRFWGTSMRLFLQPTAEMRLQLRESIIPT
jgi:hypothetical protein